MCESLQHGVGSASHSGTKHEIADRATTVSSVQASCSATSARSIVLAILDTEAIANPPTFEVGDAPPATHASVARGKQIDQVKIPDRLFPARE